MDALPHFILVKIVDSELIMIVLPSLKKLLINQLVLAHWIVNVIHVKLQFLLINYMTELRVLCHDLLPRFLPYSIAKHIRLHLIQEYEPLMKAYLKPSNDSGWPKLLSIPPDLVHLITHIVPS